MGTFEGQVAVVTGASSGIGKAITLGLAAQGAALCLVGRQLETLEEVARCARKTARGVRAYRADLSLDHDLAVLGADLRRDCRQIDILVHSAGIIFLGPVGQVPVEEFDRQYRVNVRGPYALTQALLPMIRSSRGQIVFINSSVGLTTRAHVGQYSATKHALKAIADSLREEVNADGVRVLTVFPGRTATAGQATIHQMEGRPYHPERLLQAADVAAVVINALGLERTAEVTDIRLRPLTKPSP